MAVKAPITSQQAIQVALGELGVHEIPNNSNRTPYTAWYGLVGPWCAMFVSWVLHHAGFPIVITTKKGFAYCPDGVAFFKRNNAWAGPDVRPKQGWVVFFDFPNDGVNRPSHTGLVEGTVKWGLVARDRIIATVEGNTNGAGSRTGGNVMRHNRSTAGGIIGYGIIEYEDNQPPPEEISMADIAVLLARLDSLDSQVQGLSKALREMAVNGMFRYGPGDLNALWTEGNKLTQRVWNGKDWELVRVIYKGVVPNTLSGPIRMNDGRRIDAFVQIPKDGALHLKFDPDSDPEKWQITVLP